MFNQLIISGVATGCLYALIAVGFVMIWNTAAVVNFAQGEFAMMGMFLALTLNVFWGVPLWLALPLAIVGGSIMGYLIARSIIQPVVGGDPFTVITVTIGLQIVISDGLKFIFGAQPYYFPNYAGTIPWSIRDLIISPQSVAIIAVMIVLAIGLHLISQYTKFGKILRAVSQDQEMASLMGIDVYRAIAFGFALSAGIAGVAGVLMAPIIFVSTGIGLPLLIKSFIAAILGGFGSYPGALIGGILIGVIDNLAGFYISTHYRDVVVFGVLIMILLVRPQGLFPQHR